MANFLLSYTATMKVEGGYSNNPTDKGGETYKGISRKMHPEWTGWNIIDKYSTANVYLLNEQLNGDNNLQLLVQDFYKREFWDALKLGEVNNQKIATELFDTAVNMGTGTAALFLQRALNVSNINNKDYADLKLDGQIGAKTLTALNDHPAPNIVFKLLNILQGAKYIAICEANPSQEIFLKGWLTRVFE
jgi:lysozyme family protein